MPTSVTTATSTELLRALNDPGAGAWGAFVGRYRPLIECFARRCGIDRETARDIAQSTLLEFYRSYRQGQYSRDQGRLRDWLFGIARHQVARARRAKSLAQLTGDLEESEVSRRWDSSWLREVLLTALNRARAEVEPETFEAFELFALAGVPSQRVAESLGISENAVYGAKRRVMARLKAIRVELDSQF